MDIYIGMSHSGLIYRKGMRKDLSNIHVWRNEINADTNLGLLKIIQHIYG